MSDRQSGLYLFEFDYDFPEITTGDVAVYPNPISSGDKITFYVSDLDPESYQFELIDYNGKIVFSEFTSFNY